MCLFVCLFVCLVVFAPSRHRLILRGFEKRSFTMMKNVSNETVEEASVMSGAEGARRRRTPRRGRGSTRDERRVGPQVKSERRKFFHTVVLSLEHRAAHRRW